MSTEDVKSFVDSAIASHKVAIFSKTYCPYCVKAKKAFESYKLSGDDYFVVELENRKDGAAIQQYLKELTGASSVPRVFINGQFIGGGDDTGWEGLYWLFLF